MSLYFLITPMVRDSIDAKETSDMLAQGSSITIMVVSLAAWFVAWRFYKIEPRGKKYFFIHVIAAAIYLPFLVRFFLYSYEMNFRTGKEHYLLLFFVHSAILLFTSLGFYGKFKQEESF